MYLQGFKYSGAFKLFIGGVWRHPPSVTISCHGDSLENKQTARINLNVRVYTLDFTVSTDSNTHLLTVKSVIVIY